MNAQMVYEIWKKVVSNNKNGVFPKEAEDYVLGDDSAYEKIPKGILWAWTYSESLVQELDGENSELAKRCLKSIYRMNNGIVLNENTLKIYSRIGITVTELLNEANSIIGLSHNTYYMSYSKTIYAYMADDCEKSITPSFLAKILEDPKKNLTGTHLAFCLAALLVKDGKGQVSELTDKIMSYADRVNSETASIIMREIYTKDKRARSRLAELMKNPDNIRAMSYAYPNGIEEVSAELDREKHLMYMNLTGQYRDGALKAAKQVAESYDDLLPWMYNAAVVRSAGGKNLPDGDSRSIFGKLADIIKGIDKQEKGTKRIDELCNAARPLAIALSNGHAGELLTEFEQHYTDILVYMSSFFCIDTDKGGALNNINSGIAAAHAIYKDPDEAARMIRYNLNDRYERYYVTCAMDAFSTLFDYSKKAADIVYTLIKCAEYHGNSEHYRRAANVMAFFCSERNNTLGINYADSIRSLLEKGIALETYFMCAVQDSDTYFYNAQLKQCIGEIAKENLTEAMSFYDKIKTDAKPAAYWAEMLYKTCGCRDIGLLMEMMKSKSKNVRKIAADIISAGEETFREPLEATMKKLKGDALVQAQAIIKKWDNNKKYGKDFEFKTNELAEEFVSENVNPAAVKKTAFIPEEFYVDIRFADMNGTASKELIRYIIGEYLCLSEPYRIAVCDKLAAKLYTPDFQQCIENIYQHWLENGADNKTKMIMVPYCVYASDTQILALKKQILAWAEAQRGALGAYVINAVAINGGSTALMMVNDISAKFPNNQVKKAAKAAFAYAAKALGLPEDVLADKIVPALGLDKNGEATLDYGARTFTLSLMPDFTLSFFDNEKQKAVKSLPKPSANDDALKADEAKKYVSELKKQLKAVTASQKTRLEAVFRNGRTWNCEAWNTLFVDNPVMHRFAANLIWGVYKDGKPVLTFRYADDGSFCDENDDICELPQDAEISLVHPIELDVEAIEAWAEQLSDYEIVQPFAQISAEIIHLDEGDVDENHHITKYAGRSFTVSAMNNAAKKYNFIRSSVEDAGGFSGYHIQDRVLGIGIRFGFENMYMGQDYSETVELTDVYFYQLPEEDEQPDSYNDYEATPVSNASERFISCCLGILESILD